MNDLAFSHDPGGGTLQDLTSGVSINLSREQMTWLSFLLQPVSTAAGNEPTSVDDALDALPDGCEDSIPLSEK